MATGTMKTREDVAAFIALQISDVNDERPTIREKGNKAHYGKQELRELMDFIYGSPPENERQEINEETFSN